MSRGMWTKRRCSTSALARTTALIHKPTLEGGSVSSTSMPFLLPFVKSSSTSILVNLHFSISIHLLDSISQQRLFSVVYEVVTYLLAALRPLTEFNPKCFEKFWGLSDCGEPEIPADGQVTITNSTRYQEARYECSPGYELSGMSIRRCSGRKWNGFQPLCNAYIC